MQFSCLLRLVDQFARPEELRVKVPAAHAVEPARAPRHTVGRLTDEAVAAVLTVYRQGDDHDDSGHDSAEEKSDGHCDYDTGHGGLQHFRAAEFLPRLPLPATPAWGGVPVGLMFVGQDVPVWPRSALSVLYIQLSLTVLLSGAIWHVLVRPSSLTARIEPAIRAIPTFGTLGWCTTVRRV